MTHPKVAPQEEQEFDEAIREIEQIATMGGWWKKEQLKSPKNARHLFDAQGKLRNEADLRQLGENMLQIGQRVPILVDCDGNIIDGQRRFVGGCLVGIEKFWVAVGNGPPSETAWVANVLQKEWPLFDKARALAEMQEELGLNQKDLAARAGVCGATVSHLLLLDRAQKDFPPELIEWVHRGDVTQQETLELAKIWKDDHDLFKRSVEAFIARRKEDLVEDAESEKDDASVSSKSSRPKRTSNRATLKFTEGEVTVSVSTPGKLKLVDLQEALKAPLTEIKAFLEEAEKPEEVTAKVFQEALKVDAAEKNLHARKEQLYKGQVADTPRPKSAKTKSSAG